MPLFSGKRVSPKNQGRSSYRDMALKARVKAEVRKRPSKIIQTNKQTEDFPVLPGFVRNDSKYSELAIGRSYLTVLQSSQKTSSNKEAKSETPEKRKDFDSEFPAL